MYFTFKLGNMQHHVGISALWVLPAVHILRWSSGMLLVVGRLGRQHL